MDRTYTDADFAEEETTYTDADFADDNTPAAQTFTDADFLPDTPQASDQIGLLDAIDQNTGGMLATVKGIPSNLAAAGKMALGDVASVAQRFQGALQSNPTFPQVAVANRQADELNRATAQMEQEAAQQDIAAGRSEFFGKTVRGVTRSLATAAPMGMALGPAGAIGGATLIQGSQSATEALDAGIPEGERARFVAEQMMWEGLPATLMQRVGLGGLESQLGTLANPAKRGISAALKQFGVSSLQELPEEYVTALGQAVSRVASGVGKPEEIGPDGIYNLMRDVTAQTLGTTGLVSAAGYRPASQAPATPTPQPSPTSDGPPTTPQDLTLQPEPQYDQTYEQEFGDVWADLAQETPQAQPAPTPSPDAEVAPQATVAPTATPSETPEQFAERVSVADQMSDSDSAYYRENQAAVDEALRQMYDQYAEVDAVDNTEAPQPAESEVIPSEEKGQEAEVLTEPQAAATPEPPAPQQQGIVTVNRSGEQFVPQPDGSVLRRNGLDTVRVSGDSVTEAWIGPSRSKTQSKKAISEARKKYPKAKINQSYMPIDMRTEAEAAQDEIDDAKKAEEDAAAIAENDRLLAEHEANEEDRRRTLEEEQTAEMDAYSTQREVMRNSIESIAKNSGWSVGNWVGYSSKGRSEYVTLVSPDEQQILKVRISDHPQASTTRGNARGGYAGNGSYFDSVDVSIEARPGDPVDTSILEAILTPAATQQPTPIRFKRSGKGDTAVHEASIEGRAVTISKGKDGWEVRLDGRVADVHPTMKAARDYATGELRQDLVDQRNASEEEAQQRQGPAPADTGIYRDLTSAAREGKRFVEALYPRIQPVLARIHAEAKSAVDFVRRAVAKIGEHIKPYARRFLADVRAVNKEFRQNPTRGSVPTPEMPKRGKVTGAARGAGAPKLPQGMEPDAQTRQAGVVQGHKEGVLRQQQDTRAMLDIARQVLPAKEWRAIAKAAMSISRMRNSTEAGKRRALDRVLGKHLSEIRRGQALSKTQKTIKAIKQKFNKLRPEVQDAVTDIFKGFREKNITEATYNKALSVLARGTSGKDAVTPKELARAAKIIESFEGDDKPELLRNLSKQDLESINDVLESLMEKNDAMNAGIVAEMERQKIANNTLAVEEVKARGPVTLKNLAFENKVFRSIGDTILNLPNIVRGIATKSGHVYKTLVSDLVEADTKTQAMLLKHSRIIQRAVAEAGITPDQIRSMSAIDNNKAEEVEVAGVKMTKGERISLLLHLSDPDTRAILMNPESLGFKFSRAESGANRRLKITPEVAEEIENSATPEELKLARIFFDWSNGEVMNDVNEWSTRVFGYKMFRNDQHWNRRRNITDKEPAIGLQADGTQAQQEATDYLKDRTGGTSHIIVDDAFQHVASHMNAIAALVGKFEASVNARRLLGTSAFQDAVAENRRTGGKILQELNKRINEWGAISNPRPEAGMRFVRWAGRNYTASKLATNFSVIISQPFSVLSAAKVIPSKYIAKTFAATPMDVNALAEIEATPEAADLYYIVHGGGQHIVTPGSMAGATMGDIFKTAEKPFTDKMMTFVERGNDMAVFNIWRAAKAWGQDQGLSGDELMRFTAKTARDAWLQTQPSHSSVYHSGIKLRSRSSPTAYALSMFQGQTAIQFQDAIDSVRDYQELPDSQKTAAERAKVMAKFARPIILQAAMFEALKYAGSEAWDWIFGKSDAKKARDKKIDPALDKFIEVVKSPVSSIPGLGPILDTSIEVYKRMALGMPKIDTISNPILSSVEDVALAPAAAIKILNRLKDGKEPRLTDARALARGVDVLSGVPTGNFVEWVSALSSMLMR